MASLGDQRAIAYVKTLQDKTVGFQYSASRPRTSVVLTAAALSTLHATGTYAGPEIDAGYDYIWRSLTDRELKVERGQDVALPFPYRSRNHVGPNPWAACPSRSSPSWCD